MKDCDSISSEGELFLHAELYITFKECFALVTYITKKEKINTAILLKVTDTNNCTWWNL